MYPMAMPMGMAPTSNVYRGGYNIPPPPSMNLFGMAQQPSSYSSNLSFQSRPISNSGGMGGFFGSRPITNESKGMGGLSGARGSGTSGHIQPQNQQQIYQPSYQQNYPTHPVQPSQQYDLFEA